LVALGATALVVLVLAGLLLVMLSGRRRLRAELAAYGAELVTLREQVDALARPGLHAVPAAAPAEFVITQVGAEPPEPAGPRQRPSAVSSRTFASVAAGESLVRLLSLGHGVRRALSSENRNRIAFEMRRELRRSRKQRRRDLKEARRSPRAEGTAA
jgi:hypothetical protein